MTWFDLLLSEQVFLCRQIINNILIKVWLSQSYHHIAAVGEKQSAWGIILPLQGLEEGGVITIDKANHPVF